MDFKNKRNVKNLAEAVILQSMEDLWNPSHKRESLLFFRDDAFRQYAELAGISYVNQYRILMMLAKAGAKTRPGNVKKTASF